MEGLIMAQKRQIESGNMNYMSARDERRRERSSLTRGNHSNRGARTNRAEQSNQNQLEEAKEINHEEINVRLENDLVENERAVQRLE